MNDSQNITTAEPEGIDDTKKAISFSFMECVYSIIILMLAFGFVRFAVYNTFGFLATGIIAAMITASILFMKKSEIKLTRFNCFLAVILYLFSLVYSITDNVLIEILDTLFLISGIGYFVYSTAQGKKALERFLPFALVKAIFEYPLKNFSLEFKAVNSCVKSSKFGSNLKMIIIGLIVTIPLTSIVGILLMSADIGVANMLESILDLIAAESIWQIVCQIIITIPCACYIFSMFYSNVHREKSAPLSDEECEKSINNAKCVPNMIIYTAVTPICILYIMFFISQTNYFLSAFYGRLPEGYIYSVYARKGFFELCIISVINFVVILIINLLAKNSGRKKPLVLKIYSILLCFFTLIMIAVAISKMVIYISAYGLTRLRVYTMWFMILIALFFVIIGIKQLHFEFSAAKWGTAVFTVMFAVLCFSRPDAAIAKYNIEMYNAGLLTELDINSLFELSDDAVLTAVKSGILPPEEAKAKRRTSNDSYNISSIMVNRYLS